MYACAHAWSQGKGHGRLLQRLRAHPLAVGLGDQQVRQAADQVRPRRDRQSRAPQPRAQSGGAGDRPPTRCGRREGARFHSTPRICVGYIYIYIIHTSIQHACICKNIYIFILLYILIYSYYLFCSYMPMVQNKHGIQMCQIFLSRNTDGGDSHHIIID